MINIKENNIKLMLKAVKSWELKYKTMPVLDYAEITQDGVDIKARITDLEHEVITSIATISSGQELQRFLLPIIDIKALTYGTWTLEDKRLKIENDHTSLNLPIIYDDFPAAFGAEYSDKACVKLESKELSWLETSISKDETRYNINGLYFDDKNNNIVATDGHRLHYKAQSLDFSGIMHYRAIKALSCFDNAAIYDSKDNKYFICLTDAGAIITTRKVDGQYPDYPQVIPKQKGSNIVSFSAVDLKNLKDLSAACTDRIKTLKIELNGACKFTCSSPEKGIRTREHKTYTKTKDATYGLSVRYLLDALALSKSGTLFFSDSDELAPIQFSIIEKPAYNAVIMPTRLD